MPMCAVINCSRQDCPAERKKGITFHRFPSKYPELWNAWNRNCFRSGFKANSKSVICSQHFEKSCFDATGQCIRLKDGSIPTLIDGLPVHLKPLTAPLSSTGTSSPGISSSRSRTKKSMTTPCTVTGSQVMSATQSHKVDSPSSSNQDHSCTVENEHSYATMQSPRKVKRQLTESQVSHEAARKKLKIVQQFNRRVKKNLNSLEEMLSALRQKNLVSSQCCEMMNSFDTVQNQIFRRCAGEKGSYSDEMKAFASTLHFYSPKAYKYVRETFGLALPHPAKIKQWYGKVEADPGFTRCAFDAIKLRAIAAKEINRQVIVSIMIDEMSIRRHVEWTGSKYSGYVDVGSDAPCNDDTRVATEAFVIMAVAMNDNWKVPLGYFLIDGLTGEERANIIRSCLERVHACGVTVCALTCDGPACNFAMFKELGANLNPDSLLFKPSFRHPLGNYEVHVLFDPCHMLKLVRNCLGDCHKLLSPSGMPIEWAKFEALHRLQEDEGLRLGNKLRAAHVQYKKQKMKVNLAAQILSRSVADALDYLCCELKLAPFLGSEGTVEFIRMFNDLFDILNTRNPVAKGTKAPLRVANEVQWQTKLLEAKNYIKGLRDSQGQRLVVSRRKTAFVGFLCCIESVAKLFDNFVRPVQSPLKYVLTYKLSQDHIELFFGAIRACGRWNNNPTARQFTAAYKRLLLRHNVEATNGNCSVLEKTRVLDVMSDCVIIDDTVLSASSICSSRLGTEDSALPTDSTDTCDEVDKLPAINDCLSDFKDAAVSYIAGFVCKMVSKILPCQSCKDALENPKTAKDSVHAFISLKNRGGLVKPSVSVQSVCKQTEKYLDRLVKTNKALPRIADLRLSVTTAVLGDLGNLVFQELSEHVLESSIEDNHVHTLVKLVSENYAKIRLYQLGKQYTEIITGDRVRKTLSKLILFQHQ